MADSDRISSVYDIPEYLARNFPATTGPLRAAGNALMVPADAVRDAGSAAVHGALGLEEPDPWGNTGRRVQAMKGALGDTAAPAREIVRSGAEGLDLARQALREQLIEKGARPKPEEAAPPRAAAPATPAMATARAAMPPEGLQPVADPGISTGDTVNYEVSRGKNVTLPTMIDGKRITDVQAIKLFQAGKLQPVAGEPTAKTVATGALEGQVGDAATAEAFQGNARGALEGGSAAGPAMAPGTSRESLDAQFRKKVAEIEKTDGRKLTDDQKKELQMDFFLRLMANGSRPGSNLIGNAGEAGIATSGLSREMRNTNMADQKARKEDAFREVGFADKDQDNAARTRQLDLLSEQIGQGKYDVKTGGRGGNFLVFDKKTGKWTDTGIKASDSVNSTKPAALQMLEHLKAHPEDMDLLKKMNDKDKNDSDQIIDLAGKIISGDMSGKMTTQSALDSAREIVMGAKGQKVPGAVAKPKSQAEFDALPNGSQFVNPKDGKTYTKK